MDTQVSHLCRPVVTVNMNLSIQDVQDKIDWKKISCVVVEDMDKKVIGIITEKDMISAESLGEKKKLLKISQICSRNLIKISPDDSIIGAARLMVERKVHHVLIMVGDYVEGVISTLDVLEAFLKSK